MPLKISLFSLNALISLKLLNLNSNGTNNHNKKPLTYNLSASELLQTISDTQTSFSTFHKLISIRPGEFTSLDLWGNQYVEKGTLPRYKITVVDGYDIPSSSSIQIKCGVLIIPLGRDHEWMFSSEKGQQGLVASSGYSRLVLVTMNRGHTFDSLDAVQKELSSSMASLCPKNVEKPIPFLTVSVDIGYRVVQHKSTSSLSGELIVEDVKTSKSDEDGNRRLIFLSNQHAVQSEARIVKDTIDLRYLCFDYHISMVSSLAILAQIAYEKKIDFSKDNNLNGIIIGLGGGALPSFITNHIPIINLECIELDEAVATISQSHFGFKPTKSCTVHIADGIEYISKLDRKVNVIMVDADSKDLSSGMNFPPETFLTKSFLENVKKSLTSNLGVFVMNISGQNNDLYLKTLDDIRKTFNTEWYE